MEKRIRQFKQALESEMPRRGRGKRFPGSLVAEAVSIAKEAQAAEWSLSALARELGVGTVTLERWCERAQKAKPRPATMQQVTVVPPTWSADAHGLVVHGPASLRVEGLGLDGLVTLWRKLS